MTVINMISFGREGVAVADEQSSTTLRKYNVAQKLHVLRNAFVYGGSGPSDCIREIYDSVCCESEKEAGRRDGAQVPLSKLFLITEGELLQYKNDFKNKFLIANLGINLQDFQAGTTATGRPLDNDTKAFARNLCSRFEQEMGMEFILGGIENERFEIYAINTSYAGLQISRPYHSIGSGADESEKVLSAYVSRLPRVDRDSIHKIEGLVKILEATNASSRFNVGVGGSPSIAFISKGGIKLPNENQCILSSELVNGLTWGLLDRNFVYNAVGELIYGDGDFHKFEEEMMQNTSDPKKLDRLLRGYKE